MQLKRYLPIFALLLVAALLTACAAQPAAPAAPTAAPAEATTAPAEPTAAPAEGKTLIAGVVFQSDTFMQTVQAGMQAAADEAGVEMIMGNTENKLDKEASLIDDYITRGVKAIVITPISADGSIAALKKAKDAGIVIFCFNTCVNDDTIPSGFLVTKNSDLGDKSGAAAAQFIADKLGGEAVIGILNCDQFEGCPPRKEGFLAQVSALPGVKVAADQAGWLADKAQPVSEAMLQANPDINVLWAANEGGTVAHANAVKTLGLAGKVFVFGTDMNNQMGQMLQADDDILQGVTGQAPYQMGFDALKSTLEVLGGATVEPVTNTPTIFFGRGNDALIKLFMDTEGNAIFEVPEEAAKPAGEKPLIAGVVFQSDTFMQTVQAGMQAAADELGAEMIMGNTENKLDKEASLIDDYITRGVTAIVITPISAEGSVAALKKAKEAGITIVCFNTCVAEDGIASAYLVTKNEDLGIKSGEAAAQFIADKLGGTAKIGLLNCDQFEGCPPRKEGFLAQVSSLPGVEVVADQAGWLADKAQPVSEAMLQANPDINLLWAANEGGTVAHANAVKTLGLGGQVFVFGTDMNNQMGQMLQAGDDILQGVTGQAPYQMGYDALATTLDVLGGATVEPVTNTPTIFFGRGNDALIDKFMETEGNAIFEVPAESGGAMMAPEGLLVAGVVFQSDTFMQTVQAGMQAAADETGAEIIMGNTENKLDKEASLIDDYITRGVNAIVITPISAEGSVAALKKAKEAGITIVCFNTCVAEDGIASAYLVTKNEDLGIKSGEAAAQFIADKLGGTAKIGLLNCDQFEGCPPRKEGFLAQVSSLPGVEVVADQAGWLADKAQPVSEAMLQANPDINLLWAANEGGTVAHANAVKTLGLGGQVFVFGTDMNNQMGQMLQAGDDILQGVTGQAPYQMGYDAFMTLLKVLAGEKVESVTNTPTIFFGRGNDALIDKFMETEGNAIFE